MTAIRTFLARAVPWPDATNPGFINIHWTARDKTTRAKRGLGGRAFTEHGQASNYAQWLVNTHTDIYVCMSMQAYAEDGLNSKGKPIKKAMRDSFAALLLRSFWIDVDVKPGAFATTVEAKAAFDKWRIAMGLPEPTFIVLTGSGGFHVHWVLDDPVSRETWLPLAHALQNALKTHQFPCDYGVVIDACRILRIPGTQNFKDLAHVTDATLDQSLQHTYPLSLIEKALAPYMVSYVLPVSTPLQKRLGFTPNPKFAPLRALPRLDAGVTATLPSINDVARSCPWIEATLDNGGAGYSEPLWWESVKVAAFTAEGLDAALDLSDGHDGFDEVATEAKFEQAAGTHGGGRIGWPQCRTINSAGAMECVKCPHFKLDRSPLNFVAPAPVQVVTPLPTPPPTQAPTAPPTVTTLRVANHNLPNYGFGEVPPGYKYGLDGVVYAEVEVKDQKDPNKVGTKQVAILSSPIFDVQNYRPPTDGQGQGGVSFECQTDATHIDHVVVRLEDMMDMRSLVSSCAKQNVVVADPPLFKRALMAWRDHLRNIGRSMKNSEAMGWSHDAGQADPAGFCFGGYRWTAAGNTKYSPVDKKIEAMYTPSGTLDNWKAAARLITDQNRPDLNCVIAASFAAPLTYWTGHAGMVLSIFSSASGIGKSHAMRIAQAVWGNPQTGMSGLDDTANYVNLRVAVLKHLPFFYDELRQEEDTKKLVTMIFAMGQGKSKGRLTAAAEARDVHAFSTLMTVASNNSLMSYINDHVKTTTAGINRIFELEIATALNAPGMIEPTTAQIINGGLNHNYANAGAVYARFLGANISAVKDAVNRASKAISTAVAATHDERFWVSMIAVLVVGASYANQLGLTTIDADAMLAHLLDKFRKNRRFRTDAPVDLGLTENAVRYLQDYINARRDATLITDEVWTQPGRPSATFKPLTLNANNRFDGKIAIRWAKNNHLVRVSMADFGVWLKKERGVPREIIFDALVKTAGAKVIKTSLGSNTTYSTARESALEFDLQQLPTLFE